MGLKYWLGRERSALSMARLASTAEARLIHFQLAGNYSVKASLCDPFMLTCDAQTRNHSVSALGDAAEVTSFARRASP